mmetsp:Transcript_118487/g.205795  ORF Transcript_118487/g.205795 Transcript_118487/m.205795 type:complete len:514 (-) Transcript_118487:92-1633(-)
MVAEDTVARGTYLGMSAGVCSSAKTPTIARSRATTPPPAGAVLRQRQEGADRPRLPSHDSAALPWNGKRVPAPEGRTTKPGVPPLWVRGSLMILATVMLFAGVLFLARSVTDTLRSQHIAIFREFLRRASSNALPLPERFHGDPPKQLRATWTPGTAPAVPFQFQLGIMEVPLTADVLGDHVDADDEAQLPVVGVNATDFGDLEDAKRSVLYRVVLPGQALWAGVRGKVATKIDTEMLDTVPGTLEVWLPNSKLLLRHTFEPVRWQPASPSPRSEWSGVARLCYVLPPEDGPWDGAKTEDCEYGHRLPVYAPLNLHAGPLKGGVEVVLRSNMDAYVGASEITRGCSNCHGRPYGAGKEPGTRILACGHLALHNSAATSPPCFGQPAKHIKAKGLALLGLGVAMVAVSMALHGRALEAELPAGSPMPEGRVLTPQKLRAATVWLTVAAGVFMVSALATRAGLPGVVWRASRPGGALGGFLGTICWIACMVAGMLPVGALLVVLLRGLGAKMQTK